jgi:glycerate 2-kinase
VTTPDEILRYLFDVAVTAARPDALMPSVLPPPAPGRTVVIGAGKASAAMAAAVERAWEGPLEGLVITRYGHALPCEQIQIVEAAHPVPDETGLAAAEQMLRLAEALGPEDQAIALISGGGSALMTLPPEGVSQAEMRALNRALLASGAPIDAMNTVRRHISRIGGGRLGAACHPARVHAFLISDVPGDDPVNIASGPTVPDPTTLADATAVVDRFSLEIGEAVRAALANPENETVKPGDPRLGRASVEILASPMGSLTAAAEAAEGAGARVEILGDALEGEAREMGRAMAADARARQARMAAGEPPLALISGGETTVTIPRDGRSLGSGGRNVDFLLGVAEALEGAPGIHVMAGDTDGIDGVAEIAGAVVRPGTLRDAAALGVRLDDALYHYDGHGFFRPARRSALVIGPSPTNVDDFRCFWIDRPATNRPNTG